MDLGNMVSVAMAEQELNDLDIPSTLNHSMILWFYVMLFWKLQDVVLLIE